MSREPTIHFAYTLNRSAVGAIEFFGNVRVVEDVEDAEAFDQAHKVARRQFNISTASLFAYLVDLTERSTKHLFHSNRTDADISLRRLVEPTDDAHIPAKYVF